MSDKPIKRAPITPAQKRFLEEMKSGGRLIREGNRFYLNHRELMKGTIISMLRKRIIRPAIDGAFGRSQTYLLADK
jgi:hypothetical protein